jgi:hypothetical protein
MPTRNVLETHTGEPSESVDCVWAAGGEGGCMRGAWRGTWGEGRGARLPSTTFSYTRTQVPDIFSSARGCWIELAQRPLAHTHFVFKQEFKLSCRPSKVRPVVYDRWVANAVLTRGSLLFQEELQPTGEFEQRL